MTRTDNKPEPPEHAISPLLAEVRRISRWTLRRARRALAPRPALRVPARAATRWVASTHGRATADHARSNHPGNPSAGVFLLCGLGLMVARKRARRRKSSSPERLTNLEKRRLDVPRNEGRIQPEDSIAAACQHDIAPRIRGCLAAVIPAIESTG